MSDWSLNPDLQEQKNEPGVFLHSCEQREYRHSSMSENKQCNVMTSLVHVIGRPQCSLQSESKDSFMNRNSTPVMVALTLPHPVQSKFKLLMLTDGSFYNWALLRVTSQMKAIEKYFYVVLFVMLYDAVLE